MNFAKFLRTPPLAASVTYFYSISKDCNVYLSLHISFQESIYSFISFNVYPQDRKNNKRITGLWGKGEDIFLTPHYHFHTLHRHLDISRAITAESSPLYIGSRRTGTGKLLFPNASR